MSVRLRPEAPIFIIGIFKCGCGKEYTADYMVYSHLKCPCGALAYKTNKDSKMLDVVCYICNICGKKSNTPYTERLGHYPCDITTHCKGTMYPPIHYTKLINETPRIPEFITLLERMKEIHFKKNKDYASASDPFENFKRSATIAEWFIDPVDKSFISLISTKLARLATLLNKKESPENESIEDSFLDLCTYCALWASYRKQTYFDPADLESKQQTQKQQPSDS